MSKKFNLRSSGVRAQKSQVRTYGTQTPLSSAAVERGSTRWLSGSFVSIEGLLDVAGTFNVSGVTTISGALTIAGPTGITGNLTIQGVTDITGQLNVTGPTALDGVTTIGGDTTITGLLDVEGNSTISGTLDITGRTTIAADLELLTGGKFIAGQTQIEPTGKATFGSFVIDPSSNKLIEAPGGWLFTSGPDSLGLASSLTSSMNLNSEYAELNYPGSIVRAASGKIDLLSPVVNVQTKLVVGTSTELQQNRLRVGSLPNTSIATANVHVDSNGIFYRVTNP